MAKTKKVSSEEPKQNVMSPDLWTQVKEQNSTISTELLDKLANEYQSLYTEYEEKKEIASKAYAKAQEAEGKLIEAMEQAGKTKYFVENIGTFYFSDKATVPTPKTIEDKKLLFAFLSKKHGETFLMDKVGIVHQTLQSIYKMEQEDYNTRSKAAIEAGQEFNEVFTVPGLSEPTNKRSLNLRKEK